MDREAWWAAVYGVAQSRTRLKQLSSSSSSRVLETGSSKSRRQQSWFLQRAVRKGSVPGLHGAIFFLCLSPRLTCSHLLPMSLCCPLCISVLVSKFPLPLFKNICSFIFYFMIALHSIWDPSVLTRDHTHSPCIKSPESQPLDHQRHPPLLQNHNFIGLGPALNDNILTWLPP